MLGSRSAAEALRSALEEVSARRATPSADRRLRFVIHDPSRVPDPNAITQWSVALWVVAYPTGPDRDDERQLRLARAVDVPLRAVFVDLPSSERLDASSEEALRVILTRCGLDATTPFVSGSLNPESEIESTIEEALLEILRLVERDVEPPSSGPPVATHFRVEMVPLAWEEGGRATELRSMDRLTLYARGRDLDAGVLRLPRKVGKSMEIELAVRQAIDLELGEQFAVRAGGRTIGYGRVLERLDDAPVRGGGFSPPSRSSSPASTDDWFDPGGPPIPASTADEDEWPGPRGDAGIDLGLDLGRDVFEGDVLEGDVFDSDLEEAGFELGEDEMEMEMEAGSEEEVETADEPRFLGARVLELDDAGRGADLASRRVERALVVGRTYAVEVEIGPDDEERGVLIDRDASFDETELPQDVDAHRLRVVFVEPLHAPEPQIDWLVLPARRGRSTTCRFSVVAVPDHPDFEARLIVLHENKVLQTALLRARVVDDPASAAEHALSFEVEVRVRASLEDPWADTEFGGSLVLNRGTDDVPRAQMIHARGSVLFSLEGVNEQLREIRGILKQVSYRPDDYANLRSVATQNLLVDLALQGRSLFEVIADEDDASSLVAGSAPGGRASSAVQIVSTKNSSLLPLEFVYDRGAPDFDATLCPGAEAALDQGVCQGCDGVDDVPARHVCPLGFWCTRRVIERHTHDRNDPEPVGPSEFRLRGDPEAARRSLFPLRRCGFAASDRVDDQVADSSDMAFASLDRHASEPSFRVDKWADWTARVASTPPSLIVLLPHTVMERRQISMEIGAAERLSVRHLTGAHVGGLRSNVHGEGRPGHDDRPPVVCLFGCSTENTEIPYQGLAPKFRREGAAIVITTLIPVLGRHVARVASLMVDALAEEVVVGGTSFGEVFRRLRLRALARSLPVVLCLFADGDADWRIFPNPTSEQDTTPTADSSTLER